MNPWEFLASGFGIGYAPKAPGTFGALLGLFLGALLLTAGHLPLAFGIVLTTALGVYGIGTLESATLDPGWVVIDEVAGQMVAMLALSHLGFWGLVVSFGLFRLFDIWKPGPVGWADARHDEYGIMADDLVAGGLAALVILALRWVLPL